MLISLCGEVPVLWCLLICCRGWWDRLFDVGADRTLVCDRSQCLQGPDLS